MKKHTCYKGALLIGVLSLNTLSSCVHTRQTLGMNSGLAVSNNNVVLADKFTTAPADLLSKGGRNRSPIEELKSKYILEMIGKGKEKWGRNEGKQHAAEKTALSTDEINSIRKVLSAIFKADLDGFEKILRNRKINWNHKNMFGDTILRRGVDQLEKERYNPEVSDNLLQIILRIIPRSDPRIANDQGDSSLKAVERWYSATSDRDAYSLWRKNLKMVLEAMYERVETIDDTCLNLCRF